MLLAALFFLFGSIAASVACPTVSGTYAEDDYRVEIEQVGCDFPKFVGGYALSRMKFYNLVTDSRERECFKDKERVKHCRSYWAGNELNLEVRELHFSSNTESVEILKLVRCDLAKDPKCKYGTAKVENTIRLRFPGGEALIPRHPGE